MPSHSQDNSTSTHVALHLLINQLSMAMLPAASSRKNTLVNDIAPCLLVRTNASRLAVIIRQLLDTINVNSENSFIRLSAKMFGDVLLIHIKKKCPVETVDFTECLLPLHKLVEELYGNVSVTSQRNDVTTVALSFMNQPIAA